MTPFNHPAAAAATLLLSFGLAAQAFGQTSPANNPPPDAIDRSHASTANEPQLKFVVIVSRHGVRSPTSEPSAYNAYSAAPWPQWSVAPGFLTAHRFQLMQKFGAWDRTEYARQGLFSAAGCADSGKITFYADSDQRTQQTGKALAQGMFRGCNVPAQSLAQGTPDSLFHLAPTRIRPEEQRLAAAAIAGRIGGHPDNLAEIYRAQLTAFDNLLASCGAANAAPHKCTSLLDIPDSLTAGKGDHLAELRSPLSTAATFAENLLLEYTEGLADSDAGWGCVKGSDVRTLINLHTASTDIAQRTPAVARPQASNLLSHILASMEHAETGNPVAGATSKPEDRALILVDHNTNLENIAGALNIDWIADGRRNDTPPGSALVFELWLNSADKSYSVKTFFTSQTLEQMRSASTLSRENPPSRVPLFLPGCGGEDISCSWPEFQKAINGAIESRYVQ